MDEPLDSALESLLRRSDEGYVDIDHSIESETSHHETLWARYRQGVAQLERRFGVPQYRGPGPRWGAKWQPPGTKPYNSWGSAIEVTWWCRPQRAVGLMITGHDADTLQCLAVVVSESAKTG